MYSIKILAFSLNKQRKKGKCGNLFAICPPDSGFESHPPHHQHVLDELPRDFLDFAESLVVGPSFAIHTDRIPCL